MDQFKGTFTPDQEQEMVGYVQATESRFFDLTTNDLRKLAYQLTEKDRLPHGFIIEDKWISLD